MKKKLDLHGIIHANADNLIEDFILITKPPFAIITGNSLVMRNKSLDLLNKYDFKWMITSYNLGEILVTGF
jgi:hypothetical protein